MNTPFQNLRYLGDCMIGFLTRMCRATLQLDVRASDFSRCSSGNVAIMFGLVIVPFVSFGGISVDFAKASRETSRIQSALDAAVLAGGRAFQVSGDINDAKSTAAFYFNQQTGYTLKQNDVNETTFVLTAGSTEAVPTSFMGVLSDRFDTLTVSASAQAQLEREIDGDDVEVSLMLDITGSMRGQRIADLKAAGKDLVSILLRDEETTTRIALAPFSHAVNAGPYYQAVTNQAPTAGNTCVVERSTSRAYTDHPPSASNGYFNRFPAYGSYYVCPRAEIVPLSSDKQLLLNRIDTLPTHGTTAGHLGTAWAWYLISARWSGVFPTARAPRNSLDGVQKITVLMSDGQYNRKWFNNPTSDGQARRVCDQMKQASNGIEVYAVGFELEEGSSAYNRLKNCATDSAHFFPAGNGDELKAAFRAIAFKIAELRLVN